MNPRHARAFEQLEEAKDSLLEKLASKDEIQIAKRHNEKWSPLEHAYHIHLAEKMSRLYCQKKLSFNPDLDEAGLITQCRVWILKIIELVPLKFKAPKAIGDEGFPENLNFDLLQKEWSQDREDLKSFLNDLDKSLVNKEIYKQPSVGRLTIGGMLEFFIFHLSRHAGHIKRDYGI